MRSQDEFNISINFNWDKPKGRKLDQSSNAQVIINPREYRPSEMQYNIENDLMLSNQAPPQQPKKTKKKKKKKSKKLEQSKDSKECKEQRPTKLKCKTKQINNLPWGLNQERLRNYLIGEQSKMMNALQMQKRRQIKTDNDLKQRRDQLGVSFLNNLPQEQVKKLKNKPKSLKQKTTPQLVSKKSFNQEEIQQYKEYKYKMQMIAKQEEKKREFEKQVKIHNNLQNLNQFIQKRNRSLSCDHKKRRTTSTYQNDIIYEHPMENQVSERVPSKKRKVVLQFKNQQDQQKLIHSSKNESMRQPCSSIYQFMSNSSSNNLPNESDPEQDLGNLDDSFYSQKIKMITDDLNIQDEDLLSSQKDWDEQDKKEIEEIRSVEKAASKISEKRQKSEQDEQAAIKIQKMWRGFKTRQILGYYLDYFQKEEQNEAELDLNQLTKSQIQELIKLGYLKIDSKGQMQIQNNTDPSLQETPQESTHSLHRVEQKQRQSSQEAEGSKHIFEAEAYQEYMEQYSEEESDHKLQVFKKKKRLSIDVDEIEKEYGEKSMRQSYQYQQQQQQQQQQEQSDSQQGVDIGEMRSAIGSESLIKSLREEPSFVEQDKSLFDQSSFQDFMQNKFKELLRRDKMDELIHMREMALEERHTQQKKSISEAYKNKQISPKTFDYQSQKLEKWVSKQRKDLEQKKQEIKKGQQSTYETVMKTQRDLLFMKQISQSNSQSYIKVIDSFSQESVLYSEASHSAVIDIPQQNQNLFIQEDDLSKSSYMNDDEIRLQNTSPDLEPPQPFNLQRLAQSQVLRVSDIVKDQQPMSEKQADSYSIVITNMIIAQEIQQLYSELNGHSIDLFEIMNKAQFAQIQQPKQSKGFKTNINQIKGYIQFVSNNIIESGDQYIIEQMNKPLGPSSKEMLKFLRPNLDQSIESDDTYAQTIILNTQLFGEIEGQLIQKEIIKQSNKHLLDLEHIHNKSIFDALNEALDYHRPYGINGQPFIWKTDSSRLTIRQRKLMELPKILQKSQEKVIEWCQCLVGIMVDKEDSPYPKILMFDQECLAQIKEDRMIRMLSQEILEQDDRWVNYDEELAEVGVELSLNILDYLLDEFISELNEEPFQLKSN